MKHPVLQIKKGSRKYDDREDPLVQERAAEKREERRQELREQRAREQRRRPSFRLRRWSLLPVLVIVLIAAVLLRFVPGSAARANIAGWHAVLQTRVFGDSLRVGVAFSRLGGRPQTIDFPPAVTVLFWLPETGEQVTASGILSEAHVALRSQMRYVVGEKTLRAIVRIDGQTRTLSVAIPGP